MSKSIFVDISAQLNLTPAPFGDGGTPIYAVMLTGKDPARAPLAYNAVASFLLQTYPNRHLFIVNDGEYHFKCAGAAAERVTEFIPPHKMLVGDLRNFALPSLPANCVWIQWDDDDWHHPLAMETQFALLQQRGLEACTLSAQVKYAVRNNVAWEHQLPPGYNGFAGTVMVRSSVRTRYPSIQRDEDSGYWAEVLKTYRSGPVDLPGYHYIRFVHPTNSSPHLDKFAAKLNLWNLDETADAYVRSVLPLYHIPLATLDARNRVHTGPVINA